MENRTVTTPVAGAAANQEQRQDLKPGEPGSRDPAKQQSTLNRHDGLTHLNRTEPWTKPLLSALVAVLGFLSLGALTGSLIDGPSEDLTEQLALTLQDGLGPPWTFLTSGLFASSWLDYLLSSALLFIAVTCAVRFVGIWRTALAFTVGTVGASTGLMAVLDWGSSGDNELLDYLGGTYLLGIYGGLCAMLGLATAAFGAFWQRRLRLWLVSTSMMLVLYLGHGETALALLGSLIGIGLGMFLLPGVTSQGHGSRHSSLRETRVLISTVLAVFALGLALSQLTANFAVGPLSAANLVLLQNVPDSSDVGYVCAGEQACITLQGIVGISSPGAVVLSLIPVILLLVCADGLRRGRRLSWWITVLAQAYMAAAALLNVVIFYATPQDLLLTGGIAFYLVPMVLVPAIITGVLIATRHAFAVRSSPEAGRSTARIAGFAALTLVVLYVVSWLLEGNLRREDIPNSLGDLLIQIPHLFIPFQLPFNMVLPQGLISTVLYTIGGVVFWLILLFLLIRDWRRYGGAARDHSSEHLRASALVRVGGGSMSHMALWDGNFYWFTADQKAGVAYQVHHGVALTVAGPFGDPASSTEALRGFTAYAVEMGLAPCFYSAPAELGPELAGLGFRSLEVAEETVLRIQDQNFKGKDWQNVRTAINKARKLGITEVWGSYPSFSPGLRAQVLELSEEWVSERALPQLGFTLGGPDELKDESVMCCLAVDETGTVLAITSWLPVYREGEVVSWTLDFMRRRSDSFNGIMDFLIAAAVRNFQSQVTEISLSGSPLASTINSEQEQNQDAMNRLLSFLAETLEPFYGFRSLAAFKARFKPVHRTLYMYYQDPLALASIGLAVTEAYLPGLSARQRTAMIGNLIRGDRSD